MYFIITIDTEGDDQWSEAGRGNITTENARYLPRFQSLCEEFGYRPTYLTSYEMAESAFFVDFAKSCLKKATCEIGIHPHAWNCPPQYALTDDDRRYAPYLMEYPREVIADKIGFLKKFLENTFEARMVSHRSGRWAFSNDYAQVLDSLQLEVDCSVTPHLSWERQRGNPNGQGGTDYTRFPSKPYFVDLDDISKPGKSQLLEMPMTIRKSYWQTLETSRRYLKKGSINEAARSLLSSQPTWFRPDIATMKEISHLIKSCAHAGDDYLMFMLHSSEFMPGANPVYVSANDIDRLFADLKTILESLRRLNVKAATCSEYYRIFEDRRRKS
jgi:hypothetical protein